MVLIVSHLCSPIAAICRLWMGGWEVRAASAARGAGGGGDGVFACLVSSMSECVYTADSAVYPVY